MKKILLLVTGMSPQIVTETLYGLAVRPADGQAVWIPDEIHVISTTGGLTQIRASLFKDGHFARLLAEYQLPSIRFDEDCLHKINNENGAALADLKTPADNEYAANAICEQIRSFTQDPDTELHVSIAGGRKTMGFYAGYALSLYGRVQDRMSHVLVSSEFESSREFFYPASSPQTTFISQHGKSERLDAYEAQVWLANIPFVRLRHHLPEKTLLHKAQFSEVVALINQADEKPSVIVDVKNRKLWVHNKQVDLKTPDFAFYLMFLCNLQGYVAPAKRNINRPLPEQKTPESDKLAEDFLAQLELLSSKMDARTDHSLREGMFEQYFSSRNSSVNKKIIETLGHRIAAPYLICQKGHQLVKGRNAGVYGLEVLAQQIEIK